MVNVTMLTFGRPRLTEQALRTLKENTPPDMYALTTYDNEGKTGTGQARNEVIRRAGEVGRGEYLYLSDNDVAFLPQWIEVIIPAYEYARKELNVAAIGGYCHPYHQPYEKHFDVGITWSLPTQSMLMSWDIWHKYGPFNDTPVGLVNQSEDWNFTERLRADGLRVGAVYPHVVLNTGRHDTFGALMVGHELVKDITGLIVE